MLDDAWGAVSTHRPDEVVQLLLEVVRHRSASLPALTTKVPSVTL